MITFEDAYGRDVLRLGMGKTRPGSEGPVRMLKLRNRSPKPLNLKLEAPGGPENRTLLSHDGTRYREYLIVRIKEWGATVIYLRWAPDMNSQPGKYSWKLKCMEV